MTDRITINHSGPSTVFNLEADVIGLYTVRFYLRCNNGPSGSTGSVDSNPGWQMGLVDGYGRVITHGTPESKVSPFLPSGYAANAQRWRDGPVDINFGGGWGGGLTLRHQVYYGDNLTAGLALQPQAPTPVGIDSITPVSLRYMFSGNGNGGAGIDAWEAQLAEDAAFTVGVQTVGSGGTTTFGGLTPGKRYYCRSRGHNGVGWGAYSSTIYADTLSGGRYWNGTAWQNVIARYWNGTAWQNVIVRSWDGAAWRTDR